MNRDVLRQISVILITIVTLIVNGLATSLPLNGVTTAKLSDSYWIRFVPAGYVFSVWGIIYTFLIAYCVYQALPSKREDPRLRAIGWWFVVGSTANTLWLVFWHYYQVEITLVMMLTLLATLIYTVTTLKRMPARTIAERICVDLPFHIYTGWISVATVVNVSVVIFRQGTFSDETAIFWTLVLIGVAVVLAISQRILRQDTAYGMVIAWALYGLGVKQIQYVTNEAQLPPAPLLVTVASTTAISLAVNERGNTRASPRYRRMAGPLRQPACSVAEPPQREPDRCLKVCSRSESKRCRRSGSCSGNARIRLRPSWP
jgi:hypothetical protein